MKYLPNTRPRSTSRLGAAVIVVLALAPLTAAQAYVGPGAGLSLLGALWGVIAAVLAALLFVLTWPLRRMRRRKREEAKAREAGAMHTAAPAASARNPADTRPPEA